MRVVIAEDLFLLRDGLTRMLQAHGLQIAAAVDNGADLLAAVTADQPDVAIVDVRLPPTFTDEGIRAALAARREVPGLPVLVLSQYVEQLYGARADGQRQRRHRVPAQGPGVRQRPVRGRGRRVAAGGTAMDPEVIARLLARNTGDGTLTALSPREREVLALMAEGRSNAAIAQRLVITERAVAKHTASIFLKELRPAALRRRQPPRPRRPRLPRRLARSLPPPQSPLGLPTAPQPCPVSRLRPYLALSAVSGFIAPEPQTKAPAPARDTHNISIVGQEKETQTS